MATLTWLVWIFFPKKVPGTSLGLASSAVTSQTVAVRAGLGCRILPIEYQMYEVEPHWLGLGATSFPLGFPDTVPLLKMYATPNSSLVCGKQVKMLLDVVF